MNNNPSPGNKAGGLTTILEKSLGAVAKGGTSNLEAVYEYAEPVTAHGFVYMDTPGYDPVSATGQVAGGANMICFTTGRGSAYGCAPSPSLKLATNSALWQRQEEDMDINCGEIVDGTASIQEMGQRIFELVLATASGEHSQERAARLRAERVRALAGRRGDVAPSVSALITQHPPFGTLDGTGIEKLDPRFNRLVPGPEQVERLWTGARWCEGPAWFGAHRTLVWSDIPNNRMMRFDERNGTRRPCSASRPTTPTATRSTARAGWSAAST